MSKIKREKIQSNKIRGKNGTTQQTLRKSRQKEQTLKSFCMARDSIIQIKWQSIQRERTLTITHLTEG